MHCQNLTHAKSYRQESGLELHKAFLEKNSLGVKNGQALTGKCELKNAAGSLFYLKME